MADLTYWGRHVKYTIPPAIALTILYRPFFTPRDVYRILFLISIAVTYTIPWDAYLIKKRIWTYPSHVVWGQTLFGIPYEEVFFFVIQTYTTSLLYLFTSKLSFKPVYLRGGDRSDAFSQKLTFQKRIGQLIVGALITYGAYHIYSWGEGTYMGLILAWAGPVCLFLWSLSSEMILQLPWACVVLPIALPTFYLWVVDTLALQRGTWAIESGTKLGIHVWPHLEIEEAVFFFVTNLLIVFGLSTFDHTIAILETFPNLFPKMPECPGLALAARALSTSPEEYDEDRIQGIKEAVRTLKKKSRSFYLASSVFSGRLRIDLTLLYAFCRVADDLVDNAATTTEASQAIDKLKTYLDIAYSPVHKPSTTNTSKLPKTPANQINLDVTPKADPEKSPHQIELAEHINSQFQSSAQSALRLLPTSLLSRQPLYDLLKGFETDLTFPSVPSTSEKSTFISEFPIQNDRDLELYAQRVAGTVAELCLELVFHHSPSRDSIMDSQKPELIKAGGRMGVALQYVNIARDILVDARINRVYIPSSWLEGEGLTAETLVQHMTKGELIGEGREIVERLQGRLLDQAFEIYQEARPALDRLPSEALKPMTVAVESYMEIGRVLREQGSAGFQCGDGKKGRATVPKSRRIKTAWKVLNGF